MSFHIGLAQYHLLDNNYLLVVAIGDTLEIDIWILAGYVAPTNYL